MVNPSSVEGFDEAWNAMTRELGLEPVFDDLTHATPLLRSGQLRRTHCSARGGGRELALYTSADLLGRNAEADHDYTLVVYDFPAGAGPVPTLRYLSASARTGIPRGHRGAVPTEASEVFLESAALSKRFTFHCESGQTEQLVAMFEPSFMTWFTEHGLAFQFETGKLVVITRFLQLTTEFSDLLERADKIAARLAAGLNVAPSFAGLPAPR